MSLDQVTDFVSFNCPPVDIRGTVEEDVVGLFVNRLCPVSVLAV